MTARASKRQETLRASQVTGEGKVGAKAGGAKRLSSRVTVPSQRGLEANLEELEQKMRAEFDLETKFGPVTGMTRLERYERAERMQLDPPTWVKERILAHGIDSDLNQHLFASGKL